MQGIYGIQHRESSRIYIGSSIQVERRWRDHIYNLDKNKHVNQYLQNAWNKYGKDAFSFTVIEIINDKDTLLTRELFWMRYYTDLYNIIINPNNPATGNTLSIQGREALVKAATERWSNIDYKKRVSLEISKSRKQDKQGNSKRQKDRMLNPIIKAAAIKALRDNSDKARLNHSRTAYAFVSPEGIIHNDIKDLAEFCNIHRLNKGSMRVLWQNTKLKSCKGWKKYILQEN